MNLEKSKKRISKRAKMGFQGYPEITITYLGSAQDIADEVAVSFTAEEGSEAMTEKFSGDTDVREDAAIQSAIVKMIERSEAKTVVLTPDIELKL